MFVLHAEYAIYVADEAATSRIAASPPGIVAIDFAVASAAVAGTACRSHSRHAASRRQPAPAVVYQPRHARACRAELQRHLRQIPDATHNARIYADAPVFVVTLRPGTPASTPDLEVRSRLASAARAYRH